MSAIERWRSRAAGRHSQSSEDGARPFAWDDKRAAWFNRFATRDRSPTYNLFRKYVTGEALEIGPGPGAYTRLLVRDARRVVAVEPSLPMIERLRANLPDQPNLEIVASTIEEYLPHLKAFDFALAANVLGGIERLDEVLEALGRTCRCLVISSWDVKQPPAWQTAVETEVLRRPSWGEHSPRNDDMLAVIAEVGLTYEVMQVSHPQFSFERAEDLLGWVGGYLDVPEEELPRLTRVVLPHCSRDRNHWVLPTGRESVLVRVQGAGAA